jgi:hypothetical protein
VVADKNNCAADLLNSTLQAVGALSLHTGKRIIFGALNFKM